MEIILELTWPYLICKQSVHEQHYHYMQMFVQNTLYFEYYFIVLDHINKKHHADNFLLRLS